MFCVWLSSSKYPAKKGSSPLQVTVLQAPPGYSHTPLAEAPQDSRIPGCHGKHSRLWLPHMNVVLASRKARPQLVWG